MRKQSLTTSNQSPKGALKHNPNKSFEVTEPPKDSVSSLSFSPRANLLVATSWDNKVRCWEISRDEQNTKSVLKGCIPHEEPVLCSTWKDDGTTVFSGGCDNIVKMWPLSSRFQTTVATHDAPVREVAWIPEMNLLVTGSWDKTLRYWDVRQSNPVHIQQLPERCYAMTVRHPLMVVGTADLNLIVFDLRKAQIEFKRLASPLGYQTRCLSALPDKTGFLVGSIGGRVGLHNLDDSRHRHDYTFRCHRYGSKIYSVNSINFHPVYNTFATAGSDGVFNFWDKTTRRRIKATNRCRHPIPCSTFNYDGSIFAYASCYDWSKGAECRDPAEAKPYVFLHFPREDEVKSRQDKKPAVSQSKVV